MTVTKAEVVGTRLIWLVLALMALVTVGAFWATGIQFTISPEGWRLVAIIIILLGLSIIYGRFRFDPWISCPSETLAQLIVLATIGFHMCHAATRLGAYFPLADQWLADLDSRLGFNWIWYHHTAFGNEWLLSAFAWAYGSLGNQVLLVLAILIWSDRLDRINLFILSMAIGLMISNAIYIFVPSITAFYHHIPAAIDNKNLGNSAFLDLFHPLRDSSAPIVDLNDLIGLMTFPSFHMTAGVLVAWAAWCLPVWRWIFLAVNLLMSASIPAVGGHFLIDCIAGIAIAILSVQASRAILKSIALRAHSWES